MVCGCVCVCRARAPTALCTACPGIRAPVDSAFVSPECITCTCGGLSLSAAFTHDASQKFAACTHGAGNRHVDVSRRSSRGSKGVFRQAKWHICGVSRPGEREPPVPPRPGWRRNRDRDRAWSVGRDSSHRVNVPLRPAGREIPGQSSAGASGGSRACRFAFAPPGMTVPFVNELRTSGDVIHLDISGGGDVIHIRVQSAELWDTVRLDAEPWQLVGSMKAAALESFYPGGADPDDFVVKLNGFEILHEGASLDFVGVKDGSTLLLSSRRRRAVR